jgi:hypothetical protein
MSYRDELKRRQKQVIRKVKKALPSEAYLEVGTSGVKGGVIYKKKRH